MKIFKKLTVIAIVACLMGSLQGANIQGRVLEEDLKLYNEEGYFSVECNFPYSNVLVIKVSMNKQLLIDKKKVEIPKESGGIKPGGMFYYRDYNGEIIGHPYWEGRYTVVDINKNGLWEVEDYVLYTFPINVKYEDGRLQPVLELYEVAYLQIDFMDTGILINLMEGEDYRGKFRNWEKYRVIDIYSHEMYYIRNRVKYSGDIYSEVEKNIINWGNGSYEVKHNNKLKEDLEKYRKPY